MYKPLADEIRPDSLEDVVGQQHILGENGMLRRIIESGKIPNMILPSPGSLRNGPTVHCASSTPRRQDCRISRISLRNWIRF